MNMDCLSSGSSKQRRNELKAEGLNLGMNLPFNYGKPSQLHTLKAACVYLKKKLHFSNLNFNRKNDSLSDLILNDLISQSKNFITENLFGFIVCFTTKGELIYVSENVKDYIGFKSMEIILNYDYVYEMAHDKDRSTYENIMKNPQNSDGSMKHVFYSSWFVSKIKRKKTRFSEYKLLKITCHYDSKAKLFVAICKPVLTIANRDILVEHDPVCFHSTHKLDLEFLKISANGCKLLGYEEEFKSGQKLSLYNIVSPDDLILIKERHSNILNTKNPKGVVDQIRLAHKNGFYLDALLNIYHENSSIACKFQIMNSHADLYKEYLMNFVDEESNLNQTDSNDSFLDLDLSEESFADFDEDSSPNQPSEIKTTEKRKIDDFSESNSQEHVSEAKQIKLNSPLNYFEVYENEEIIKINFIKQKLEEEVYGILGANQEFDVDLSCNNGYLLNNNETNEASAVDLNNNGSYSYSPLCYENQNIDEINFESFIKGIHGNENNLSNEVTLRSVNDEKNYFGGQEENLMLDFDYFQQVLNSPEFRDCLAIN